VPDLEPGAVEEGAKLVEMLRRQMRAKRQQPDGKNEDQAKPRGNKSIVPILGNPWVTGWKYLNILANGGPVEGWPPIGPKHHAQRQNSPWDVPMWPKTNRWNRVRHAIFI
jgi:hypothetical protein